jgi:membrane AbrB-like protein
VAGRLNRAARALGPLLAASLLGGGALGLLGVPAGWLSGAMLGVAALAAAGRAAPLPAALRQLAIVVAGVGMGSGVTPDAMRTLARYPVSLALMTFTLFAMTGASYLVLARSRGFSKATSLYSAVPGALSYVFIVAAPAGADMPRLAVIQIFRIFILMAIVPLVARAGFTPPAVTYAIDPVAWTAGLVGVSWLLGMVLEARRISSGMLYAAILVSGLAHGLGWAPGRLALPLQAVAQLLIGAWIGTRFIGFDWSLLRRALIAAITSFLAAFAVAASFAMLAAWLVSVPFAEALIAFAPGGLEAMTMMAFALGLDPLYVGSHHIARFFIISLTLPFAARWLAADSHVSPAKVQGLNSSAPQA